MPIQTYMTYSEVRAVIGAASKELTDAQLGLDIYDDVLQQELAIISGVLAPDTETRTLEEHYTYLKNLASPTSNQVLLRSYIRTFAIYTVAASVVDTASLLFPKTISDGKALVTRFSPELTFEEVQRRVYSKQADLKQKIRELLGITITDRTYVTGVAPQIDVVTGVEYE